MAPELNNPPGMAAAALVAAVFLAAGVWLYVQGSRAAHHTRAAESGTDGRELAAFPAAAPQESIANNMGVDYASRGKYEKAEELPPLAEHLQRARRARRAARYSSRRSRTF